MNRRVVREADWKPLDNRAGKIFKEKQSFDRLEVSKENLKKMFSYSKVYYSRSIELSVFYSNIRSVQTSLHR